MSKPVVLDAKGIINKYYGDVTPGKYAGHRHKLWKNIKRWTKDHRGTIGKAIGASALIGATLGTAGLAVGPMMGLAGMGEAAAGAEGGLYGLLAAAGGGSGEAAGAGAIEAIGDIEMTTTAGEATLEGMEFPGDYNVPFNILEEGMEGAEAEEAPIQGVNRAPRISGRTTGPPGRLTYPKLGSPSTSYTPGGFR